MTILDALKADHDEVKGLLKTILASKDGKKRGSLRAFQNQIDCAVWRLGKGLLPATREDGKGQDHPSCAAA